MTPQNASISPRTRRTFRKSPDPVQRFAAFAACMRGSMSSVRRGDFLFRTKLAPCIHVARYRSGPASASGHLPLAFDTWQPRPSADPALWDCSDHRLVGSSDVRPAQGHGLIVPLRVSEESEIDGFDLTSMAKHFSKTQAGSFSPNVSVELTPGPSSLGRNFSHRRPITLSGMHFQTASEL